MSIVKFVTVLFVPGETLQEVIEDVTAVRVARQSGTEKQILEVAKTVCMV